MEEGRLGREATRSIIASLEKAGYMRRTRSQGKNGEFNWVTDVYSAPVSLELRTFDDNFKSADEPSMVDSHAVDALPVEPSIYKEQREQSNEEEKKDIISLAAPIRQKKICPTRCPDSLALTPEMLSWGQSNVPSINPTLETANFLDHHRARGTVFVDWIAAWRTWMRNAVKFQPLKQSVPYTGDPARMPHPTDPRRYADGRLKPVV